MRNESMEEINDGTMMSTICYFLYYNFFVHTWSGGDGGSIVDMPLKPYHWEYAIRSAGWMRVVNSTYSTPIEAHAKWCPASFLDTKFLTQMSEYILLLHTQFIHCKYQAVIECVSMEKNGTNEQRRPRRRCSKSVCTCARFRCPRLPRHQCVHFVVDTFDVYCQPKQNWIELSRDFALCVCLLIFFSFVLPVFKLYFIHFLFIETMFVHRNDVSLSMFQWSCYRRGDFRVLSFFCFCSQLCVRCSRQCML